MEITRETIKYAIDETTSANNFHSTIAQQKPIEQTIQRVTPEKPMDNSPTKTSSPTLSPWKRGGRGPKEFRRSPSSRTPKASTITIHGSKGNSVSSYSVWSPDAGNAIHITRPRQKILDIPLAKRRALMGYNLPDVNEQNYVSCPAMSKCKVTVGMCV